MTHMTFADLIARARDGDEDAINALLRDFEDDVRIAVRRHLPKALRTQFDSMDFVQNFWASVFAGGEVEADRFENREHLLGFLTGVARNKVYEEYRRRTRTRKYDLRREVPLYVRRGDREEPRDVPASDPTPSQNMQERDRFEQLTSGRDSREAQIVELRLLGLTNDEIAERTGMHERTVRRIADGLYHRMEQRQWR
ncbi:hypothetical protein BH23PLA1_BH23PLA1_33590 [soil metagenome]